VARVLGYRSGGPGSIPGTTRNKKVVGLEWGPLSLVSTTEELLDRKVAAPVQNPRIRPQGSVTLTMWHPLSAKKLAITSPTSSGRSVGIVLSRTQTMELFFFLVISINMSCRQFSDIKYTLISLPIHRNMVDLIVGFAIWKRPSIFIGVAMCEHRTFDCEIFSCGKVYYSVSFHSQLSV
jgi:hypothetical protein